MLATGPGHVVLAARWTPDIIINSLYLVGALLLGAIIIAAVSRWRRREGQRLSANDQLAHFRSLYEKGTLSAEEFTRLRALLGVSVHEAVAGKKPPATATPQPGSPPAPNGQEPPEQGTSPA